MPTPEPSLDLQRWNRRHSITSTSLKAIVERAHDGPTVPPFTGLPDSARRELVTLSLQALTELRELTEEHRHPTHPASVPSADRSGQSVPSDRVSPTAPAAVASGRQPRSAWPAMDALPEALWIEDISVPGRPIVYTNQAFTDLTGHFRDQVLGAALSDLQTGLTDPAADAALRGIGTSWAQTREEAHQLADLITDRRSGSAQVVIRHAEGYLLHAQLTVAPVLEADGGVVHYVAVLRTLR